MSWFKNDSPAEKKKREEEMQRKREELEKWQYQRFGVKKEEENRRIEEENRRIEEENRKNEKDWLEKHNEENALMLSRIGGYFEEVYGLSARAEIVKCHELEENDYEIQVVFDSHPEFKLCKGLECSKWCANITDTVLENVIASIRRADVFKMWIKEGNVAV